jgi:hypothetical protein
MPDDHYDDAPESSAGVGAPKAKGEDVSKSSDSEGGKTSILPKHWFGNDVQPGDRFVGRVHAVHEDDIECAYEGAHGGDEDEGEKQYEDEGDPGKSKKAAEGSMASMMSDE